MSMFISTRDDNKDLGVTFQHAMLNPNAPQGGLYTFSKLPLFSQEMLQSFQNLSYKQLCEKLFSSLNLNLNPNLLQEALQSYDNFDDPTNPAPLHTLSKNLFMLNLHSGPTRAFKDMALQPFGVLLSSFAKTNKTPFMILAATSGDTGPATLQSFANKEYIKVVCLYPSGGTSDVQRLQMTTQESKNCKVIGIKGDFDDAQSALKNLLANKDFIHKLNNLGISLSAANSVNIGRIVFQIVYHFWAYISAVKNGSITFGEKLSIVVPSGNFGNILGAFFAKKMGLPIHKLVVASNVNNILSDFINTGVYDISFRHLIKSKSPAMDILKSSNVERMLYFYFGAKRTKELMENLATQGKYSLLDSELALVREDFSAMSCDDTQCLQSIAECFKNGYVLDPHTAIGYYVAKTLQEKGVIDKSIILATAEWSKFAPSVSAALTQEQILESSQNICDEEAIKTICAKANCTISKQITDLFSKDEVQKDVLDVSELESHIIEWLKTF